jgi:hypothetical protein
MKSVTDGTTLDFDGREVSQASTSKFIQANIPSVTGYIKETVAGTPVDVIVKPNLKVDICATISFKSILSFLGSILPLPFLKIPSSIQIKEALPTTNLSQYGKVVVHESKGGFVTIRDETPGNNLTVKVHPSGTYQSINNAGANQQKIVDDSTLIINKNFKVSIGLDHVEVISGNEFVQIKKNKNVNVGGDFNENITGNSTTVIGKDRGEEIKGNYTQTISKDSLTDVSGNATEHVVKNHTTNVDGNEHNTIAGSQNDVIGKSLHICIQSNGTISAKGSLNLVGNPINLN